MKTRITISFLIGLAIGAVYWLLSPVIFGNYEPWDYSLPLYWVVISLCGLFLGILTCKQFWSAILGLYSGQCLVALLRPQPNIAESTPILIGLATMAIYSSPGIVTGAVGWLIHKTVIWKWLCSLEEKLLHTKILEVYHGIKICDCNHNDMDNQDFLECTKKALDYIKEVDERIFNRVKNELEYIVNTELNSSATYVKRMQRCDIDFGRYCGFRLI